MLTRIQHFIEAGEHKINEIQVRFNKLSDIFNRYDTAQSELELSDDTLFWWQNYLKLNIMKSKQSSLNSCTQLIFKVLQLTMQVNQTMTLSMAINSIITYKEERRYITASSKQSRDQ